MRRIRPARELWFATDVAVVDTTSGYDRKANPGGKERRSQDEAAKVR